MPYEKSLFNDLKNLLKKIIIKYKHLYWFPLMFTKFSTFRKRTHEYTMWWNIGLPVSERIIPDVFAIEKHGVEGMKGHHSSLSSSLYNHKTQWILYHESKSLAYSQNLLYKIKYNKRATVLSSICVSVVVLY